MENPLETSLIQLEKYVRAADGIFNGAYFHRKSATSCRKIHRKNY